MGKKDILLSFDSQKGLSLLASKENLLYTKYFKEVHELEKQICSVLSEPK